MVRGKSYAATVVMLVAFATLQLSSAQAATSRTPSAAVEVVYTVQGEAITTFNVDPTTGQAMQVGQPLQVGSGPMIWQLATTPDDRFIYVMATGNDNDETLSAYATDAQGVPQEPAIQNFRMSNVSQPAANTVSVDPNGNFAYVTLGKVTQNGGSIASTIYLFLIDPNSGKLTSQGTQGAFTFSPCCGWAGPDGFNSAGTRFYETTSSSVGGSAGADYYYQPVDLQTGALGKRSFLIDGEYDSMYDVVSVAIGDSLIAQSDSSEAWVNVYPFEPNPKTALIHCTAGMLPQCAGAWQILLDPSGQYLLITTSADSQFVVTRIDLNNKALVPTGGLIPDHDDSPYFSPDGTLFYMAKWGNGNPTVVQIYLFNPADGTVTVGGQISTQATAVYTADRS